jgi:hypothetical protein
MGESVVGSVTDQLPRKLACWALGKMVLNLIAVVHVSPCMHKPKFDIKEGTIRREDCRINKTKLYDTKLE